MIMPDQVCARRYVGALRSLSRGLHLRPTGQERFPKRRDHAHGQVMPMTLLFMAVVVLALWVMYDAGELMSEKTRLQNTADNVAYSTAALVSRDLNFIAYTNRAMAANQVAIAQLVGISSWAASMEQFAANLDNIGHYFPVSAPFTGGFRAGMSASADAVDAAVRATIPVNEWTIDALSFAQLSFHMALVPQLAEFGPDIGRRNDPDAMSLMAAGDYSFTEAATLVAEWNERIGAQNALHEVSDSGADAELENRRFREFENVVQASRDRFTRNRSYDWGYPFSARYGAGIFFKTEARKYGASEFFRSVDPTDQKYRWDWAGMETVSQYVSICVDSPTGEECEELPEIPFTWGAAHVLDGESRNGSSFFDYGFTSARRSRALWGGGTWRNDASAGILLTSVNPNPYSGDHVQHHVGDIDGLRDYYEFRSDEPSNVGPPVIALYVKNAGQLDSQRTLMQRSGGKLAPEIATESHGGLIEDRIGAAAKAEPYFMRPTDLAGWRRDDRRIEYGSLFNPYWQPRLVDLTDQEKLIAAGIVTNGTIAEGGS